jgi:ankyrin repeat protein
VAAEINQLSEEGGTPLTLACELDNVDLIEKMIALQADPTIKRKDGISAIEVAIKRDCVSVVRCLLKYVALTPHAIDTVAREGSVEMLTLLSSLPAFYSHRNSYNDSAFHTSIRYGNLAGALFIVANTNDPLYLSAENDGKETAFSLAAALGAWKLIRALLKKQAVSNANIISSLPSLLRIEYSETLKEIFNICQLDADSLKKYALMAAQAGNYLALSYIFVPLKVQLGTLIGPNGWRIPHYLAKSDGLTLFRTMIVNEGNFLQPLPKEEGKTLAYIAASNKSKRVLRVILQQMKKENVTLERHFKDRHLFYAVIQSVSLKSVHMFLEAFDNRRKELVNVPLDASGLRPIHLAAKMGSLGLIKFFISEKADVIAIDANEENALCHALRASATPIINHLLEEYGTSLVTPQAILMAASQESDENFDLLMKLKQLPDQDKMDHALALAVQQGKTKAINRLRKQGAIFNSVENEGITPLLIATDVFAAAIQKKENLAAVVSAINASSLNEPIQMQYNDEVIWGTPFQLLLRIHKKAISAHTVAILLQRADLDPNVSDSDGNTLAHLLLSADIFPALAKPINWALTNKKKESPLQIAAGNASQRTLLGVLEELKRLNLLHLINSTNYLGRTPIYDAMDGNKEANIKLLIEYGADLNCYDDHLITPLIFACVKLSLSLEVIKLLLNAGADPNKNGTFEQVSPLHIAIGMKKDEITRCLLFNGASCQTILSKNFDLVHEAAKSGNTKLLRLFVAKGLDIYSRDRKGMLPIHHASLHGETETVKALLAMQKEMLNAAVEPLEEPNHKVESEEEDRRTKFREGATPLILAALQNKPATMQFLLKRNPDVEVQTKQGVNALSASASHGSKVTLDMFLPYRLTRNPKAICSALGKAIANDNLDIVISFYERSVPINAEIVDGFIGIQLAALYNSLLATQWLLQQGADPFVPGPTGEDALQLSAANDSWAQFNLLLEFVEPNLDELRSDRETLLHTASKAGKLMHVMLLLSHYASLNIKDSRGNLPIHLAVQKGHASVARMLLACGADSSAKTPNGKALHELVPVGNQTMQKAIQDYASALEASRKMQDSQLHFAVRYKNPQAVLLQTHLMDVDQVNGEGKTALHIAVEMDQEDSCLHLLQAGANVNAKDGAGRTPLSIARTKKLALTELLMSAGAK